jgi:hypothetical protein
MRRSGWKRVQEQKKAERRKNIIAPAAMRISPSAGPVRAAFRSATPAWKKISGD